MSTLFSYFEQFIVCITPIIVAWFAYRANQNEKQTKKYMESQEALKAANAKLKDKEREELQEHFSKIDQSLDNLSNQVGAMEQKMSDITAMDKRISSLVEMSNLNFEFCTSLSSVISSIGSALDSSDLITSENLEGELNAHKERERALINRACKIVY